MVEMDKKVEENAKQKHRDKKVNEKYRKNGRGVSNQVFEVMGILESYKKKAL